MPNKPRILWCSQSASLPTGYGVITKDILMRLHNTGKYEIIHHAWEFDTPHPKPEYPHQSVYAQHYPFKVLCTEAKPEDPPDLKHGLKNIQNIINIYKPDITVLFADVYWFPWVLNVPELSKTHLVIYYPVDGLPIPPEWLQILKKADTVITYNKFGENVQKQIFPDNGHMIYHGIDYPFWSQPIPSKDIQEKKQELFGDPNVFVWGMVARNNPRKNFPAFFEAFAKHNEKHPNTRILMHSCIQDFGWNLERLANEFKIQDKIYLPKDLKPSQGISNEELRLLYHCMDVHVNTAWGEGFGVPIWESAACGIPNIAPNYSVGPEFINTYNIGQLIPVGMYTVEPQSHIRRALVSPVGLYKLMDNIYENKNALQTYADNARMAAALFDWSKIIPQWEAVLDKIMYDKVNNPLAPIAVEVI